LVVTAINSKLLERLVPLPALGDEFLARFPDYALCPDTYTLYRMTNASSANPRAGYRSQSVGQAGAKAFTMCREDGKICTVGYSRIYKAMEALRTSKPAS